MEQKLIEQINQLAKKKREQGLTTEELALQQKLYKQYLADFRKGFDKQLDNVDVKTSDGKVTPIKEFYKNQNK